MFSKSEKYKKRHGCATCKYEHHLMIHSRCGACKARTGSKWIAKPAPKKAYCECCGSVKE